MSAGEITRPNVLVFDETPEQLYAGLICQGVNSVGATALAYSDSELALADFDDTVKAVITTYAPLQPNNERLLSLPEGSLALVKRSHEQDVPLALVTQRRASHIWMRRGSQDTAFDSDIRDIHVLPQKAAHWLMRLGLGTLPAADNAVTAETVAQKHEAELVQQIGAGLFGNATRMRLGIWIATSVNVGDEFYQQQLLKALRLSHGTTINHILNFCSLGLIEKIDDKQQKTNIAYYRKLATPLWAIFTAARAAIDELNSQADLPE